MTDIYKPTTYPTMKSAVVVPNDAADLALPARKLWVGTGGNIAIVSGGNADDAPVTIMNVPSGVMFDHVIRRVLATGTTASNLIALT